MSASEQRGDAASRAVDGSLPRRRALRLLAACGAAAALGAPAVAELVRRGRLRRVRSTRTRMGTRATVTVIHEDGAAASVMVDAAFAEMERLEAILSRHRPATPLSRLNSEGRLDDPPPELLEVVRAAGLWFERSVGAFDPTVAPLLDLYARRFAAGSPPDASEIAGARAAVGWSALRVEEGALSFDRPGMALTLDGIAKGYIVDAATAVLVAGGAGNVLVDAGGDMASRGEAAGVPWRVGLRHPREPRGSLGAIDLRGGACIATSGDYMQAFTKDLSLHHILDPRTGRSPAATSAVSVCAPSAMAADALATAAFVLGPSSGLALLERTRGAEGLIVTKEQRTRTTPGFARS